MNVNVMEQRDSAVPAADAWWQGVWFQGSFDPRGTAFAVALALGATVAMVVVVTALVRIVAGV